jgi:hypothetical protein
VCRTGTARGLVFGIEISFREMFAARMGTRCCEHLINVLRSLTEWACAAMWM